MKIFKVLSLVVLCLVTVSFTACANSNNLKGAPTICEVCGKTNCTKEHVLCEICGEWDCTLEVYYCEECGEYSHTQHEHTPDMSHLFDFKNSTDTVYGFNSDGIAKYKNGEISEVYLPDTVKCIAQNAFCDNAQIISYTDENPIDKFMAKGIVEIASGAFVFNKALKEITLGDNITTIGNGAFMRCYNLKTITILAVAPPQIEYRTFYEIDDLTIRVPAESVQDYEEKFEIAFAEYPSFTIVAI